MSTQPSTGATSRTVLLVHRLKGRRLARVRATARQSVRIAVRERRLLRGLIVVEDSAIGSFLQKMSLKRYKLLRQQSADLRVRPIGRRARLRLVALGHLLVPPKRLIQCTSQMAAQTSGTSIRRTTCDQSACSRQSVNGYANPTFSYFLGCSASLIRTNTSINSFGSMSGAPAAVSVARPTGNAMNKRAIN